MDELNPEDKIAANELAAAEEQHAAMVRAYLFTIELSGRLGELRGQAFVALLTGLGFLVAAGLNTIFATTVGPTALAVAGILSTVAAMFFYAAPARLARSIADKL